MKVIVRYDYKNDKYSFTPTNADFENWIEVDEEVVERWKRVQEYNEAMQEEMRKIFWKDEIEKAKEHKA